MLKDEADAVVEWIEYHRLLGVEHFYIYDNNSRDGLRRRLQRYRRVHSALANPATLILQPAPVGLQLCVPYRRLDRSSCQGRAVRTQS